MNERDFLWRWGWLHPLSSFDGGILSSRSFSFGPSGPSTETRLAELRWHVRHIAVGIFLSAGWLRGRDHSHMCCWDTLSVVYDWPWPACTAAGYLELMDKNKLPQLYMQMNIKQAAKQCYSWTLMGPGMETASVNWVTALKTCLCLCTGLAVGLGEISPAGKSCRAKGIIRWQG